MSMVSDAKITQYAVTRENCTANKTNTSCLMHVKIQPHVVNIHEGKTKRLDKFRNPFYIMFALYEIIDSCPFFVSKYFHTNVL